MQSSEYFLKKLFHLQETAVKLSSASFFLWPRLIFLTKSGKKNYGATIAANRPEFFELG
jgi:hypothetical protein